MRSGIVVIRMIFFNDTATTEIYTLSLHDALPIFHRRARMGEHPFDIGLDRHPGAHVPGLLLAPDHIRVAEPRQLMREGLEGDRKSTRLNSSHANISYAVFCLKKK